MIDTGVCINTRRKCRSVSNRTSLWKYWAHLPSSRYGYELDFLVALRNAGFEFGAFAGDSMAIQLAQHLLCGIHRQHGHRVTYRHGAARYYSSSKATCAHVVLPPSDETQYVCMYKPKTFTGLLGTYNMTTNIPDIDQYNNQSVRKDLILRRIYWYTRKSIRTNMVSGNTLHIFLLPIIVKTTDEYLPLARAILDAAKEISLKGSALMVMSPLNQHFPNHRGLYRSERARNGKFPICDRLISPVTEHPDSVLFKDALEKINPKWMELIGWYDPSAVTAPLYDMHPESGATGWSTDCTHYGYTPFLFQALWYDLTKFVRDSYKNKMFTLNLI